MIKNIKVEEPNDDLYVVRRVYFGIGWVKIMVYIALIRV
jgi:hypothetical protein